MNSDGYDITYFVCRPTDSWRRSKPDLENGNMAELVQHLRYNQSGVAVKPGVTKLS